MYNPQMKIAIYNIYHGNSTSHSYLEHCGISHQTHFKHKAEAFRWKNYYYGFIHHRGLQHDLHDLK